VPTVPAKGLGQPKDDAMYSDDNANVARGSDDDASENSDYGTPREWTEGRVIVVDKEAFKAYRSARARPENFKLLFKSKYRNMLVLSSGSKCSSTPKGNVSNVGQYWEALYLLRKDFFDVTSTSEKYLNTYYYNDGNLYDWQVQDCTKIDNTMLKHIVWPGDSVDRPVGGPTTLEDGYALPVRAGRQQKAGPQFCS
jgi:hypothetical protein